MPLMLYTCYILPTVSIITLSERHHGNKQKTLQQPHTKRESSGLEGELRGDRKSVV